MRIVGFNARGEALLADRDGRIVATGTLTVDDAYAPALDRGDLHDLTLEVEWVRADELNDEQEAA